MASLVLLELVLKTPEAMITKGSFSGSFYAHHLNHFIYQFKSVENKYTNGMGPYRIVLERGIYLSIEA